jgi:hypothetical protein
MSRDTPARYDRGIGGSRTRSILELLTCIRGGTRIAFAVGLLACFGLEGLWASTPTVPHPLTVHRSTRAVPHRFTVHPNGATVAATQAQRFEVTDAQGKPVAVHWNVSGLGCSGLACGTIDDQGVYRTPSSLPQPRVVILEAVLVSDPNYSVLTQVRLDDAATVTVSPTSAQVSTGKTQQFAAPVVGRQNVASRAVLPPLPNAVAAAPVVGTQNVARSAESLPLPYAVTAAPVVGRQNVARSAVLPPLPNAVAAAPVVGKQNVARSAVLPPLPNAVTAAPAVGKQNVASRAELAPLPYAVAAAPVVGTQNVASKAELPPLPGAVAAAPVAGSQNVASRAELAPLPYAVAAAPVVGREKVTRIAVSLSPSLPNAVAAAPAVGKQNVASKAELPPLPNAVAAAPVVGRENVARSAVLRPLPNGVAAAPVVGRENVARSAALPPLPYAIAAVSPTSAQIPPRKTQSFTAPVVGRQSIASSAVLLPVPDEVAAAPAGTVVSAQHPPVVTYRDGQLTINAQNSTLAEVLKLVAEKTGAVIEVPPGSGLDRIVEHTGPGQADDVLARLLNGSPFDFIIVGSPQRPHELTQVLLSLRQADTSASPPPQVAKTVSSPFLYTPPAPTAQPLPAPIIDVKLPTEALSPDQRGDFMKEMFKELRGKIQQQNPQQNPQQ